MEEWTIFHRGWTGVSARFGGVCRFMIANCSSLVPLLFLVQVDEWCCSYADVYSNKFCGKKYGRNKTTNCPFAMQFGAL